MNYTHNLTIEELKEFKFIRTCLESDDLETVKLELGLLKKYPPNIYTRSQTLGDMLRMLEWTSTYSTFYLYKLRIIVFLARAINTKTYYVQET